MAEVTLDEFDKANEEPTAPPTPPAPGEYKLEGDVVPAGARGKTAIEIAEENERLQRALRLSEEARLNARSTPAPQAPQPEPQQQIPYGDRTAEDWNTRFQENTAQAMQEWSERLMYVADRHFEQRMAPLQHSGVTNAASMARSKHALEFELFGDQIDQMVNLMPDKKVLATEQGWDDLISYVRGRSGNIDKYIERINKRPPPPAVAARTAQADNIGFTAAPMSSGSMVMPSSVEDMDPVTKQIAEELGMTPAEYIKYSKVGNGW
jgi:hypothetical protein